jgi:hypothetical protein
MRPQGGDRIIDYLEFQAHQLPEGHRVHARVRYRGVSLAGAREQPGRYDRALAEYRELRQDLQRAAVEGCVGQRDERYVHAPPQEQVYRFPIARADGVEAAVAE